MYESDLNDTTTTTTKLVIVPTPVSKNETVNTTSSNVDLKEQSYQLGNNTSNVVVPQEDNSGKKENYKDGRK